MTGPNRNLDGWVFRNGCLVPDPAPMKVRHVRMSEAEWAKAKQLGGSRWIRDQINKAKVPAKA